MVKIIVSANRHRMKVKFLTLMEVLLIIVVTAILIILILPATPKVRGQSERSVCMSNLRRIDMGLKIYLSDNNNRMPFCSSVPTAPVEGQEKLEPIPVPLMKYLKDRKLFRCPSDPGGEYYSREGTSYRWNGEIFNGLNDADMSKYLKVPILKDFGDFHGDRGKEDSRNYLYPGGQVTAGPMAEPNSVSAAPGSSL